VVVQFHPLLASSVEGGDTCVWFDDVKTSKFVTTQAIKEYGIRGRGGTVPPTLSLLSRGR